MRRQEILDHARKKYGVDPDYPWRRSPNYAILRHGHSRKWFAAIVDVTEDKLGLDGDRLVDVLNIKCDPLLIGPLRELPWAFPAWHMNKEHWLSILLGGAALKAPKAEVFGLLDMSYELTR